MRQNLHKRLEWLESQLANGCNTAVREAAAAQAEAMLAAYAARRQSYLTSLALALLSDDELGEVESICRAAESGDDADGDVVSRICTDALQRARALTTAAEIAAFDRFAAAVLGARAVTMDDLPALETVVCAVTGRLGRALRDNDLAYHRRYAGVGA